jgi:hypothetical protein
LFDAQFVAYEHDIPANFMAKPFADQKGEVGRQEWAGSGRNDRAS